MPYKVAYVPGYDLTKGDEVTLNGHDWTRVPGTYVEILMKGAKDYRLWRNPNHEWDFRGLGGISFVRVARPSH